MHNSPKLLVSQLLRVRQNDTGSLHEDAIVILRSFSGCRGEAGIARFHAIPAGFVRLIWIRPPQGFARCVPGVCWLSDSFHRVKLSVWQRRFKYRKTKRLIHYQLQIISNVRRNLIDVIVDVLLNFRNLYRCSPTKSDHFTPIPIPEPQE